MATLVSTDPKTRPGQFHYNECQYTIVDADDNSTTVFTGPCVLYGLVVTTVLTGTTDFLVQDGATNVVAVLDNAEASGVAKNYAGIRCDTSLICNPDDTATGRVTVIWRKANPDQ